jgi:hypothetical protein
MGGVRVGGGGGGGGGWGQGAKVQVQDGDDDDDDDDGNAGNNAHLQCLPPSFLLRRLRDAALGCWLPSCGLLALLAAPTKRVAFARELVLAVAHLSVD